MILTEQTTVPGAALPIAELTDHLRLSSGFADDGTQNERLEHCLRAALAAIEARTGKAIYARRFGWELTAWNAGDAQVLPLAPVSGVVSVKLVAGSGAETVLPVAAYQLVRDAHRPALVPISGGFPTVSRGGVAEIEFDAGFGAVWSDIPADLRQAVLRLAGGYFDHRDGDLREMPADIIQLLEPYRAIRIGGRS